MRTILLLSLLVLGRGSRGMMGEGWSYLCKPLIGAILGLLLGVEGWLLLAFAILYYLSEGPAPAPFCTGLITDKYQHNPDRKWAWFEVEYFRTHPWLGVAARGLISFIICAPLFLITDITPFAFLIVIWPLALWIGTKLPTINRMNAWEWAEILRPFILGIFVFLLC